MIFCVEDDRNIRELLVYTLSTTGYQAQGFDSGKELFQELKNNRPELILLDIMLPGEDGYAILDKLKANSSTKEIPVIMVTAKGAEFDTVKGLDAGADDYITKHFGMMYFLARVKAVLRRSGQKQGEKELHCGSLTILVERHEVQENGRLVELTLKEFEVLKYLVENKGIVLTRDQLLGHVWGYDFDGETRTVDVHIRSLRQKLGKNLREYAFPEDAQKPGSIWQLLMALKSCELKNDALLDVFYEKVGGAYKSKGPYAVYFFHGSYDVPRKGMDKESQWESEEVYQFLICAICPVHGDYEPGRPECGFLFPAFTERCANLNGIDIFQADTSHPHMELIREILEMPV